MNFDNSHEFENMGSPKGKDERGTLIVRQTEESQNTSQCSPKSFNQQSVSNTSQRMLILQEEERRRKEEKVAM